MTAGVLQSVSRGRTLLHVQRRFLLSLHVLLCLVVVVTHLLLCGVLSVEVTSYALVGVSAASISNDLVLSFQNLSH